MVRFSQIPLKNHVGYAIIRPCMSTFKKVQEVDSMIDVLIIGAGIEGTTLARRLSRYKLNITILEKENDVSMGSTKANSAIVHGGYAEAHSKLKGRVCYKGRIQYKELDKELNFGFRETGSLVITMDENDLPKLEELKANGELNGLTDLEILNHDRIMEIEPNINPEVKYALYCKGAGVCSPYEMAIAMAENAIENGAELHLNTEVTGIEKVRDHFVVKAGDKTFEARYVVNAAGLYADKIDRMVNEPTFSIFPRSGEYLLFAKGTGSVLNTVVFQMPTKMGKGILVTSTYHGNLLLGPDALDEKTGSEDRSTDIKRLYNIYKAGLNTTDKIDPKKLIRTFSGLRAVSSTDDFIIGPTKTEGFINIAGIQSPGLTSAPAIADMVTEILESQGLVLADDPNYNPHRKAIIKKKNLSAADIKRLSEMESCPEKIICRCEQVTEGEIVDALHRGIKVTTVDGVKRRTRSSMGFCQGAYCRPRVAEIIEREYGIELDPRSDIQAKRDSRVVRQDFVKYCEEHPVKENK